MKPSLFAAPVVAFATVLSAPAWAGSGQIDSFGASASSVVAGSWVDFAYAYSVIPTAWSYGGSNLEEPAPQEGFQTWSLNWYSYEYETITEVWINAGGNSFHDWPAAAPGSAYGNSGSYSTLFDAPGDYTLTIDGGWNSNVESYTSNESAWRECSNIDPGGSDELQCSWWTYEYTDISDSYSSGGSFASSSLNLQVSAVPEPPAALLALLGAGTLAWRQRRRARSRR